MKEERKKICLLIFPKLTIGFLIVSLALATSASLTLKLLILLSVSVIQKVKLNIVIITDTISSWGSYSGSRITVKEMGSKGSKKAIESMSVSEECCTLFEGLIDREVQTCFEQMKLQNSFSFLCY